MHRVLWGQRGVGGEGLVREEFNQEPTPDQSPQEEGPEELLRQEKGVDCRQKQQRHVEGKPVLSQEHCFGYTAPIFFKLSSFCDYCIFR